MQLKREIYVQYEIMPELRECLNVFTVDLETFLFSFPDFFISFVKIISIPLQYASMYLHRYQC